MEPTVPGEHCVEIDASLYSTQTAYEPITPFHIKLSTKVFKNILTNLKNASMINVCAPGCTSIIFTHESPTESQPLLPPSTCPGSQPIPACSCPFSFNFKPLPAGSEAHQADLEANPASFEAQLALRSSQLALSSFQLAPSLSQLALKPSLSMVIVPYGVAAQSLTN